MLSLVRNLALASAMGLLLVSGSGCGGREVVRGSQEPSIDNAAMSTGIATQKIMIVPWLVTSIR